MLPIPDSDPDVLIVGAGPAGLSAAVELKKRGVEQVIVLDRERIAGGVPRHCFHTGFGIFDRRKVLSGPKYASGYVRLARDLGVSIQTETTAIAWGGESTHVRFSSPAGIGEIRARAVLLTTGCRERPRSARMIAGGRPEGVLTTGSLQQIVYLNSEKIGTRAVVVGAEHVSFSAVDTLFKSGCRTVGVVTEHAGHQTYSIFQWWVASRRGVPVLPNSKLIRIHGRKRVEAVDVVNLKTGEEQKVSCDTVILTGDWIPDNEFARLGNITINRATNGPEVNPGLRTSRPGVFAAGNLLRGAETADTAALEGRHAAREMIQYLSTPNWSDRDSRVPIQVTSPIRWVSPNAIDQAGTGFLPRNRFVFTVDRELKGGRVQIYCEAEVLYEKHFRMLLPNRGYGLRFRPPGTGLKGLFLRYRIDE